MAPEMPAATYNWGETVLPVCPTWYWCGYQPASVAALDAPTAAPRVSASASITVKPSGPPTPRPPETTIDASARSGRPPATAAARPVIVALPAASSTLSARSTRAGAPPPVATASTELGRTVMMGVPLVTFDWTTVDPPKTLCVQVPSAAIPTASVMMPESVRTASRAAASLPSAVEATSTAAGARSATNWAKACAAGTTRDCATPGPSATTTVVAPWAPRTAAASSPNPGPTQTATGSPSAEAAVSNSPVTFLTVPADCSTSTSTSPIAACSP